MASFWVAPSLSPSSPVLLHPLLPLFAAVLPPPSTVAPFATSCSNKSPFPSSFHFFFLILHHISNPITKPTMKVALRALKYSIAAIMVAAIPEVASAQLQTNSGVQYLQNNAKDMSTDFYDLSNT